MRVTWSAPRTKERRGADRSAARGSRDRARCLDPAAGRLNCTTGVGLQGINCTPAGFRVRRGPDVVVHLAPPRAVPLVVPHVEVVAPLDRLHADSATQFHARGNELALLKGNSGRWPKASARARPHRRAPSTPPVSLEWRNAPTPSFLLQTLMATGPRPTAR